MSRTIEHEDPWLARQAELVGRIVWDMKILSGDVMGPAEVSWQDAAGTLMTNLEVLAAHIRKIREGTHSQAHSSHLTVLFDQLEESVREAVA